LALLVAPEFDFLQGDEIGIILLNHAGNSFWIECTIRAHEPVYIVGHHAGAVRWLWRRLKHRGF
jgi:hypothetical protein